MQLLNEVKNIDSAAHGKTARSQRWKDRKKVVQQAVTFSLILAASTKHMLVLK